MNTCPECKSSDLFWHGLCDDPFNEKCYHKSHLATCNKCKVLTEHRKRKQKERRSKQIMTTATIGEKYRTLWIGNQPNPEDRLQVDVDSADSAKIPPAGYKNLGREAVITDRRTGRRLMVKRASCGLGSDCVCALELVKWYDSEQPTTQQPTPRLEAATPRPWDSGVNNDGEAYVCQLGGFDIAEMTMRQSRPQAVAIANAQLIVRAVNAHDALYKALKYMNHVDEDEGYCICPLNDGARPDDDHASVCADSRRALRLVDGV